MKITVDRILEGLQSTFDLAREYKADGYIDMYKFTVNQFEFERSFAERIIGQKITVKNWKVVLEDK